MDEGSHDGRKGLGPGAVAMNEEVPNADEDDMCLTGLKNVEALGVTGLCEHPGSDRLQFYPTISFPFYYKALTRERKKARNDKIRSSRVLKTRRRGRAVNIADVS